MIVSNEEMEVRQLYQEKIKQLEASREFWIEQYKESKKQARVIYTRVEELETILEELEGQ